MYEWKQGRHQYGGGNVDEYGVGGECGGIAPEFGGHDGGRGGSRTDYAEHETLGDEAGQRLWQQGAKPGAEREDRALNEEQP